MLTTASDVLSMVLFAHLVESRSFTAAAAKLGVSKSVVSARLSELEARLGTRLVHRTTRRLSPTAEGLAFYDHCARIRTEADAAIAGATGAAKDPIGVLRVHAPPTFAQMYLAAPIGSYLARHPQTRIELRLGDRFVDLVDEGLDVAIRITGRLRDSSLVARKLADDRAIVCAAPSYLAQHGTPETPADLLHHACLHHAQLDLRSEWRFRDPGGKSFAIPVEPRLTVADGAVLREAAIAGLGLTIMPSFMIAPALRAGTLVEVLVPYGYLRLTIYAMTPSGTRASAKVRAFVAELEDAFSAAPWG